MSGVAITSVPTATQQPPKDDDVVAGWTAFVVFLLLIAAVAVICWSMVRQFKKVEANRKAGVFGEDAKDPVDETDPEKAEPKS